MSNTANQQLKAMINNMPEKTGHSLAEWSTILKKSGLSKHGEILKLLKGEHGVSHGFANTISTLYRQDLEGGPVSESDLVEAQYAGAKAGLRPIYEAIVGELSTLDDLEVSPKKTYVSLRRSKQFGIIKPATKTRIDLGINLKGDPCTDRLEDGKVFGGMCSHRVRVGSLEDLDDELYAWLREAYARA